MFVVLLFVSNEEKLNPQLTKKTKESLCKWLIQGPSHLAGSSQEGRKWSITMVSFRPLDRVVPLATFFMAYKWLNCDDPPSTPQK